MIQPIEKNDSQNVVHGPPSNEEMASKLDRVAELLAAQGANRFRADAYRRAGQTIRDLVQPVSRIYDSDGIEGLEELPGVGRTISRALQQMIRGGRWPLLKRLLGNDVAEHAFASVPNIGPKLAKRIHEELGIETLVELQAAAWDGTLECLPGMGEKRTRAVRESLAGRGRHPAHISTAKNQNRLFGDDDDLTTQVSVDELLDIDDEYRFKAARNQLPRTAPRQFNPTAAAWLPILHTERGDRHYTALFSNTQRAHSMGTTHDWVVIYLEDHQHRGQHGRWTVITSRFGKLRGRRIVRGREKECADFYKKRKP
jgi:DNA polymerase (family 10)